MLKLVFALAFTAFVQAEYRILNGQKATIQEYPYQASVLNGWKQIGAGAIIGPRHILTAAHLKAGFLSVNRLKIQVGSHHHSMYGAIHSVQRFDTYKEPPASGVPVDDLAVITLSNPINFTDRAQPITLVPEGQEPKHGEMLTATGWGVTMDTMYPKHLQMTRLPCIDRAICKEAWRERSEGEVDLSNNTLCAGGGTASTFTGDSGGPLVNDKKQLVGIVSWGKNLKSLLGYPAVFVNLADPDMQKYVYSHLNAQHL